MRGGDVVALAGSSSEHRIGALELGAAESDLLLDRFDRLDRLCITVERAHDTQADIVSCSLDCKVSRVSQMIDSGQPRPPASAVVDQLGRLQSEVEVRLAVFGDVDVDERADSDPLIRKDVGGREGARGQSSSCACLDRVVAEEDLLRVRQDVDSG